MELSSPKIKKFLWSTFQSQPQNFSLNFFLYFFLQKPALKKFLIFSQKKGFSYILGNGTFIALRLKHFLYFFKKNFSYLSGNRTF